MVKLKLMSKSTLTISVHFNHNPDDNRWERREQSIWAMQCNEHDDHRANPDDNQFSQLRECNIWSRLLWSQPWWQLIFKTQGMQHLIKIILITIVMIINDHNAGITTLMTINFHNSGNAKFDQDYYNHDLYDNRWSQRRECNIWSRLFWSRSW